MSDKYCLTCGSKIPAGLKYCPVCGTPVPRDNEKIQQTLTPRNISLDNIHLEDEPLPVEPQNVESTQQLDLNSIRLNDPVIPSFHNDEKTKNVDEIKPENNETEEPVEKTRHGKLYSTFIEDEEDDDDTDDNEEHHSHKGLIIFLIILVLVLCAAIYIYLAKPTFITSLFNHNNTSETTAPETAEPTVTPEITPAPEITEEPVDNGVIGTVQIIEATINMRNNPDTSADAVGTVSSGETYDVYEIQENGGLTWYRIGDGQWIADGGGWVEYTQNQ